MTLTERIETLLVGNATGLVNTFKEGGSAADAFQAKTTTTGKVMDKLGLQGLSTGQMLSKGLQVGAAVGGVALAKFAFDGVRQFESLTATVRGFQRVIGGSAEDSSRLAAATQRMGIDAGTAQSAFGQLAKRIGENKDTLAQWGVQIVRNKDGSVDFSKTLENISDKYVSIKDPAERAAFATENFGKGAQTINALLGQGKQNLAQFYAIADAHHQIFSQDDLQKGLDLSRAMKDLGTAVQGLEIQLGRMLVPALTGAAQIGEQFVEVLDNITGSSEGAGLAFTAIATGLAAAFGGPEWALAVATISAVTTALGENAAAEKRWSDSVKGLASQLDTLSGKQAAAKFEDFIHTSAEFVPAVDSMAGRLKHFHEIANDSPAAGQKLIDTWKANGAAVGPYEKILAQVVHDHAEQSKNADAAKVSNDQLAESANKSIGATKAQADAVGNYIKSLEDEKKALDKVNDALLAQQGGEIGRQQAIINETKAQYDYNDALAQYGPDSLQTQEAALNLQQAHLDVVSATDKANQSTQDLNALLKDPNAIQNEIARLQDLINKYGDADGSIQSQIDKLSGLKSFLDTLAQTPPPVIPVTIPNLDDIIAKLNYTVQTLNDLTSNEHRIAVSLGGDPINGITGVGGLPSDRNIKHNIVPVSWN